MSRAHCSYILYLARSNRAASCEKALLYARAVLVAAEERPGKSHHNKSPIELRHMRGQARTKHRRKAIFALALLLAASATTSIGAFLVLLPSRPLGLRRVGVCVVSAESKAKAVMIRRTASIFSHRRRTGTRGGIRESVPLLPHLFCSRSGTTIEGSRGGGGNMSFTSSSQPISQYEKVVRRLYKTNMYHPVKLGLKNIEQLHEALGNPMDRENVTVIHIAGTNGKGSVALKLAKTLELVGYKTGLFVSPHISSFRERMQVNGALISESDVEELLPKLFLTCEEEGIPATFFEVTTALAFAHFARQNVDAVVLETGLGGRLDATNVIRSPALSVITSIGLEHTRILGDTVELIAKEKAGIIKPNRPVLVGPNVPHDVIKLIAEERGSEYYVSEEVLRENPVETSNADLFGDEADLNGTVDYDVENSRIAQAALTLLQRFGRVDRISKDDMIEGTSHRPPCRFETITSRDVSRRDGGKVNVAVVLDVAHNPPALKYLLNKLDAAYPNVTKRFVVGFSADKDLARCTEMLLSSVPNSDPSHIHLVQAASPRAATIHEMLEAAPALFGSNFDKDNSSIAAQVTEGLQLAASNGEVLVVCGSVFIMSEAREALGIDEPQDSDYISEVAGVTFRHGQENFADTDPCRSTNSERKVDTNAS